MADGIKAHDALARLERYGAARADHLSRVEREHRAAQVELREWERKEAGVRRITDQLGRLMGDPAAAAFFQNELVFAWVDYETALMPHVATIVDAQRKLVAGYDAAVRKLQAEDKAYESNMALVRDAIRELDGDAKLVGSWSIVQTVEFECERINGTGIATVQKSSRSGEYVSSEQTRGSGRSRTDVKWSPDTASNGQRKNAIRGSLAAIA